MTVGDLFGLAFTAALVYAVIGVGVFAFAEKGIPEILSGEIITYVLYWPHILNDALSGYTPSF